MNEQHVNALPRSAWQTACGEVGPTPAQSKPVPRARPMAAKQTAGLWTPAASGMTIWMCCYGCLGAMTFAADCGGGRLRARKTGYGVSPSFLLQALYAREPRAAAKGRPLEGISGVAKRSGARERTPCWLIRSVT